MDPREEKEEGELRRSKVMFSKMTDDDRESDDKLASAAKRLVHLMQVCAFAALESNRFLFNSTKLLLCFFRHRRIIGLI